jgi:hypothetical protein
MNSIRTITTTVAFAIAVSGSAFAQRNLDADRANGATGGGAVESSRGAVNSAPSAVQSAPSAVEAAPSAVEAAGSKRSDRTQSGSTTGTGQRIVK